MLNVDLCPRRKQVLNEQRKDPQVRKMYYEPFEALISYIEFNSGMTIDSPIDCASLYMILKTEEVFIYCNISNYEMTTVENIFL